jgi:hypothetical protein
VVTRQREDEDCWEYVKIGMAKGWEVYYVQLVVRIRNFALKSLGAPLFWHAPLLRN